MNTGSRIDVFNGPVAVVSGAEVAAVRCRGGCDAVLQLSFSEIQLLQQANAAQLKWLLRK